MKIGFIGCGKMGSALIQGVLAAKLSEPSEVHVHDRVAEPAEVLGTESGVRVGRGNGVFTEVLEGVTSGETVIVYPGDRIRNGTRVKRLDVSAR
jgi:pyrroline-5-carboxylate reductase